MAFVVSNQQYVSGVARVKLYKGHAMIVGRKSEHSLYRHELATYEEGDQYDASAAQGFIKIHGLVADHPGQAPDAQGARRRRPPGTAQHHPAAGVAVTANTFVGHAIACRTPANRRSSARNSVPYK